MRRAFKGSGLYHKKIILTINSQVDAYSYDNIRIGVVFMQKYWVIIMGKFIKTIQRFDKKIILGNIVSLLIWCLLTLACIATGSNGELMVLSVGNFTVVTFVIAPFLWLGALYGYLLSMISFVITFFTIAFLQPSHAYYLSTCLVAIICFSLFAQYFWFNKPFKALFACIITVFCVGMMDTLCLTVVAAEQYDASVVFDGLKHTATDAITIIVIGGLLHVFFTFTPDDIKGIFPIGYGYTKKYQNNEQLQRNLRKTRVSVKITAIIIGVELILGISVAGFMAILFPDVTRMLADDIHEQTTFDNIDFASIPEGEQFKEIITDEISNLNYKFDTSMLSFDIKMILLMLCVGVPLAGITNYYTKMTIGGPIGIMSDFMYEFANAPDANKDSFTERVDRIHIRNNDEIGVMYEAMRSTVYETEAYINRLKEEQRLERDLEVAKKASEAKSSFLSNMSHEIRTPINAVLGMNEMILRESNEEQILEYASNVKSAGNSLLSLVNDILDFSKIEAGKMEILPVQYHLGSLINDLINLIASRAADKNLEFEINVDEHIPANLIGDEIRIKQCVTNILTNAVKYTEIGGFVLTVSMDAREDDNAALRFSVKDTGIGVKEEDLEKLFTAYERLDEERNSGIQGTGLGLDISRKFAELMGGRLWCESVYGEGSEFIFTVNQRIIDTTPLGAFIEKNDSEAKGPYVPKFIAPDADILVVDDNPMNLSVIKGLLKSTRVFVTTSTSGEDAIEKIKDAHFDVVLMDHMIPGMDGVEAVAKIREFDTELPVYALTANSTSGEEWYKSKGFNGYLSKPIDSATLERTIMKHLPESMMEIPKDLDAEAEITEIPDSMSWIYETDGINVAEGIKNSGGVGNYIFSLQLFLDTLDDNAKVISDAYASDNIRLYTIKVHALKSSARIIGAMELAGLAEKLENAGNSNDLAFISDNNARLLTIYEDFKVKLERIKQDEVNDEDKEPISDGDLADAYSALKDCIPQMDYDAVEMILEQLAEYKLPKEDSDKMDSLRRMLKAFDWDGMEELIK